MVDHAFDKRKILNSLYELQTNVVGSLSKLQTDFLDTISKARTLPSPSALISPNYSTTDPLRCEVAPPADTEFPCFAATCYREYNCGNTGLNMDLEADTSEGIQSRCYAKKLRPIDMRLRSILTRKKSRECRCQHSPDSAYDSSSNCSLEDLEEERVVIEKDSSEDEDAFDWGDDDEEDNFTPNAAELRALTELQPSILFIPHAEITVEEEKKRVKLREVNIKWNQFYSRNSCIYNTQSCKLCKKSVRMRDSKPRVFTFITAF